MATIYGNTTNHWRCYINTWSSEDGSSVSAGLTVGIQDCGWGFQIWTGIVGTANANGASNTVNTSFNTPTGSWNTKDITSASQRFAKGHSAYNVILSGSVKNQSGYMNGTSSASQTITVPALAHHTVRFNANGGTGAPGNQTKWYGTILTLSSTKPTRTNYEFLGWSTSPTGAADYQPGGQYGADADVTLYAVWKLLYVPPKFTDGLAIRTNSMSSTTSDYSGGYCYASFIYEVDTTIYPDNVAKSIVCRYYQDGSTTGITITPTGDINKASGTINVHFSASINSVYYIECTLTDTKDGTATIARSITTGVLPMEVANQGKSVGILSAAPSSAGLNLGGSGNPDFLIAADTTNNQLESMAQIHGSTSSNGQGELTLSTQGLDSSGNIARGNINLIADKFVINGKPCLGALLYSGSFSKGSIIVPNISQYWLLRIVLSNGDNNWWPAIGIAGPDSSKFTTDSPSLDSNYSIYISLNLPVFRSDGEYKITACTQLMVDGNKVSWQTLGKPNRIYIKNFDDTNATVQDQLRVREIRGIL